MTDSLAIPPEELLQETRWLRSLAVALAGPEEADDLAQDAWLRALEQPEGRIRRLRPWLKSVVRHGFTRSREAEGARRRRELAASRDEAIPSTAELAERASMHRAVVDAVLALEEPYRSTILLRFFDDRPPREIARIQGVPVETVRTRQRRALVQLRERLDREMGGRERWTALVVPTLLGRASVGVLLMSSKTKLAAALACLLLLVAGGMAAWRTWATHEGAPRSSGLDAKMTPQPLPPPEQKEKRDEPPVAAAEPTAPPAAATAPSISGIQARVHVTDEQGQDVAGASVAAASVANPDAVTTGTTDASGEALLTFPAPGLVTLRTTAARFAPSTLEAVPIVNGGRFEVDLIPLTSLRVHLQDPEGQPVKGARVQLASSTGFAETPSPGVLLFARETDDAGTATFDGIPVAVWSCRVRAPGFVDACSAPGSRDDRRVGPDDATIVLPRGADLVIRFEDAVTGAPVAGVQARITPDSRRGVRSAVLVSAEDGTISLGRLPDAATEIKMAGTGSHRWDEQETTVPPGVPSATIRVSGPSPLACRVMLEDGTPVTEALLEYVNSPLPIPMAAENGLFPVARQGVDDAPLFRFVTANAATAWIRLYGPKSEYRLVAYSRARIKGQVVDQDGAGVPGALITFSGRHGSTVYQAPPDRPPTVVTTSDSQGFFEAAVGGSAIHLVEVSTSIGTCARVFTDAARVNHDATSPYQDQLPHFRTGADGVCDVGKIVVPTKTGSLRVTVNKPWPGGSEIVATPLDANKNLFPARRAPVRSNLTAEISGLPEGEYDVSLAIGRGSPFVAGFGQWGTRVRVVAGEVTAVTIAR